MWIWICWISLYSIERYICQIFVVLGLWYLHLIIVGSQEKDESIIKKVATETSAIEKDKRTLTYSDVVTQGRRM